ncbi:MAG: biotin transporter BioY [Chloroflexi bacterium]|nr:biotin transporter BioY [Chloroflexota bacterium]
MFDSLFPAAGTWHRIAAVIAMAGLTAGLAQARFYLPDNPVPITFQTLGVLLTGGLLGLRWGLASAVLYYLAGMAGLPVFQSGGNGWQYAAHGATGGYLLGFILATGVTGYLSQRGWNRGSSLWPMTISALLVYGPALVWLSIFDFGWPAEGKLFSSAMYPFIPGDVVKLLLAAVTVGALWRVADRRAVHHRSGSRLTEGGNTER